MQFSIFNYQFSIQFAAVAQMAEHHPPKVGVAGSSPVCRSASKRISNHPTTTKGVSHMALFTPEELEELRWADEELEADFRQTQEEIRLSRHRDRQARLDRLDHKGRKIADQRRAYREANREKIADQQRAYYKANREKIADRKRAYYEANREKIADRQRAYREANREAYNEYYRNYRRRDRAAACVT